MEESARVEDWKNVSLETNTFFLWLAFLGHDHVKINTG